jgi:hypothetical protein
LRIDIFYFYKRQTVQQKETPAMDQLQPVFVRLKASTVEALKAATIKSSHRSMAGYVDDVLRRHLALEPQKPSALDALTRNANQLRQP